jgi:hypothetical protein
LVTTAALPSHPPRGLLLLVLVLVLGKRFTPIGAGAGIRHGGLVGIHVTPHLYCCSSAHAPLRRGAALSWPLRDGGSFDEVDGIQGNQSKRQTLEFIASFFRKS